MSWILKTSGSTRPLYPFSQLFQSDNVQSVRANTVEAADGNELAQTPIGELIPDGKKIAVVFTTNANGFALKGTGDDVNIEPKHLNKNGILSNEADFCTFIGGAQNLNRKKVEVKFLICECNAVRSTESS
mmetsp:Transcript_15281/g.42335  ORF Transcript_15281/g.42335 Transcript_15281/m.42335 type:complete len:130 (-) Transcript_15281:61-450(-)